MDALWSGLTEQGPLVVFMLGLLWMLISGKLVAGRELVALQHELEDWKVRAGDAAATKEEIP